MTQVFSKEMLKEIENTSDYYDKAPKLKEYVTAVNKVFNDYKEVMDKQKKYRSELNTMKFELLKLEEYKKKHPEMVLDTKKMKAHRAKERELQEQIEEAEMFIAIDFQGKRAEKIKEFDDIKEEARAEYNVYTQKARAIREKLEIETRARLRQIDKNIGAHPFLWTEHKSY